MLYGRTRPEDYRLTQAADLVGTVELTSAKYLAREQTRTDEKLLCSARVFRNNYIKTLKHKRFT